LKRGLGIAPEQVTDIVISHTHWDHADGVDLFPRATMWIQKDEYDYYIGPQGEVLHPGGVDADDAKMFAALKEAGRVRLVDGDAKETLPGITVYTGGKHTYQSQFVGVQTSSGIVVLASDNAYLYENLDKRLAIAQTLDADANVAAQQRMIALAATPALVIPGHDPAVFERFPAVAPGVVKINR
jgi:glyoxylase-like metal-dependent hydrolase (beta-lactamase superfamily II)